MIRNNFFSFQDIEAVIFDFDGTLADSEPIQCLADYTLLQLYKVDCSSEILDIYKGWEIVERVRGIRERYCLTYTLDEMLSKRNIIYHTLAREQLQLFPHMKSLILKLAEMKIPMAVASTTLKECLINILDRHEVNRLLATIVSSDEMPPKKTYSDILLEAAKRMNVEKSKVLVFEDSVDGVISAKQAGMKCIAIPYNTSRLNHEFMKADILYANGRTEFSVKQLFQDYN